MNSELTVRQKAEATGIIPAVSWLDWCADLTRLAIAEPHRYGPDPIKECGEECWRGYFNDGYTAEAAWEEDGTYA